MVVMRDAAFVEPGNIDLSPEKISRRRAGRQALATQPGKRGRRDDEAWYCVHLTNGEPWVI